MPFIKQALDAKEPESAPEGERDLRIVKVDDETPTKKGDPMITVTIKIQDEENFALFNHWILLVGPKIKKENHEMYKLNIQRFLQVFDIPYEDDGFDSDDLQGATGRCFLVEDEGDDGIIRNKLRLPKLVSEK